MNEYVVIFNVKLTAFAWKSKSTLISLFYLFFFSLFWLLHCEFFDSREQ